MTNSILEIIAQHHEFGTETDMRDGGEYLLSDVINDKQYTVKGDELQVISPTTGELLEIYTLTQQF